MWHVTTDARTLERGANPPIEGPSNTSAIQTVGGYETQLLGDKRNELIESFYESYQFRAVLENQPSDATLSLMVKIHARRALEFAPLPKAASAVDGKA